MQNGLRASLWAERCWDRWLKPDLLRRCTVYKHSAVSFSADTTVSIWSLQPHSICWSILVCVSLCVGVSIYVYAVCLNICFVLLVHESTEYLHSMWSMPVFVHMFHPASTLKALLFNQQGPTCRQTWPQRHSNLQSMTVQKSLETVKLPETDREVKERQVNKRKDMWWEKGNWKWDKSVLKQHYDHSMNLTNSRQYKKHQYCQEKNKTEGFVTWSTPRTQHPIHRTHTFINKLYWQSISQQCEEDPLCL